MSPQLSYMEKLVELIRQSSPAPLEDVLRARLIGNRSPVHGITSPPLTRDEPDANLLLYYIYNSLKDEPTSRKYLRRAVANLTVAALAEPEPDLDYIEALGGLMGYTHVRDSEPLAKSLRFQFLGLLAFGLPVQMEQLMELQGVDFARAGYLLDLFLAVTPPLWEGIDREKRARFIVTFRQSRSNLLNRNFDLDRFHLFLLLFRAVLKLAPESAGAEALPEMCRVVASVSQQFTGSLPIRIRRAWLGMCWELGILLGNGRHPEWREQFLRGLRDGLEHQSLWESLIGLRFREIFWRSLDKLGVRQDVVQNAKSERIFPPISDERAENELSISIDVNVIPDDRPDEQGMAIETFWKSLETDSENESASLVKHIPIPTSTPTSHELVH
uniref:Uncharacterized protein n=1 Tax=Candidatus Kentrum sp. TUN TaxID=2126343 RepID=A0A450ZA96_9GAMM|nr:MAG: hypothetical protein BECKTUN1418D_GA0071000_100129 [Candidatus Kentron sp. TUN]